MLYLFDLIYCQTSKINRGGFSFFSDIEHSQYVPIFLHKPKSIYGIIKNISRETNS